MFVSECDTLRQAVESLQHSILAPQYTAHRYLMPLNQALRLDRGLLAIILKAVRDYFTTHARARDCSSRATGSALGVFVYQNFASTDVATYQKLCLKILLADRVALCYTSLLMHYVRAVWLVALFTAAVHISRLLHGSRSFGMEDTVVLGVKLVVATWLRSLLG